MYQGKYALVYNNVDKKFRVHLSLCSQLFVLGAIMETNDDREYLVERAEEMNEEQEMLEQFADEIIAEHYGYQSIS